MFIRFISLRSLIIIVTQKVYNFKCNVLVFIIFYTITRERISLSCCLKFFFLLVNFFLKTLISAILYKQILQLSHTVWFFLLYCNYNFIHIEDIKYSIELNIQLINPESRSAKIARLFDLDPSCTYIHVFIQLNLRRPQLFLTIVPAAFHFTRR